MLSTYSKLKDAVQRGGALLGATVLLAGLAVTAFPAYVFADALNPLTERSLTLSSSSPGWSYLDGSGNATYAPPNSGANGQKTGNTFAFRVSSNATVRAITFQYCTTPAGDCTAPGDNAHGEGTGTIDINSGDDEVEGDGTSFESELAEGGTIAVGGNVYTILSIDDDTHLTLTTNALTTEDDATFNYRNVDSDSTTDLNAVVSSPSLINAGNWDILSNPGNGSFDPDRTPAVNNSQGNFVVLTGDASASATSATAYTSATDWVMTTGNNETYDLTEYIPADPPTVPEELQVSTGRNNLITITSANGIPLEFDPENKGDYVKVIFFGTDTNYITNPGSGHFFVRMNTYSSNTVLDDSTIIDGGVTVANVMNESITIQTKVLETMAFSVGTHDPNKYTNTQLNLVGRPSHGQCSTLLMANPLDSRITDDSEDGTTEEEDFDALPHNVLRLGNSSNEYSLETGAAHAVESYWRLSSNSSAGATVYYTGHTLTNTVGDEIMPLDETPGGTQSNIGNEQFGLGIATDDDDSLLGAFQTYPVWENDSPLYSSYGDEDALGDGDFASFLYNAYTAANGDSVDDNDIYAHYPRLYPLIPIDPYGDHDNDGSGSAAGTITSGGTARFAFNNNADTYAVPIATESTEVVNCVTAKMRYLANIAATTPAGIYTTKINYVASPQY